MQAIIALGSNLGQPDHNLREAASHLGALSSEPLRVSSIWRTAPVGFVDPAPEFSNAVAIVETGMDGITLLAELQAIEIAMGRERPAGTALSSRTIDLDLIDLGGQVMETSFLTLPHPRAHVRRFVLEPLRELEPGFQFVNRKENLAMLIAEAPADPVRRFSRLSLSD